MPGGCSIFGLREGEPASRGGLEIRRHVGRERGASAISFSALELAPGGSTQWRNPGCDEVLFVLEGEGQIELDGFAGGVERDTGILVRPGRGLALANRGQQTLTLLSSRCPDPGPDISFEGSAPRGRGAPAPGLVPVVSARDQPIERAGDGRWFRVLVDARSGSEQVTQFLGFIPPGRAPDHFHEYEEVICILKGRGCFWSAAASAEIAEGSCIYLPRRQPHCLENTGTEPLELYGVFYPAGSPAVRYHPGGAVSA